MSAPTPPPPRVQARRAIRITLPHGETDPRKQYSFSDPHSERVHEALDSLRYGSPTREDVLIALALASDYLHLTTYALGQEHCVRQLRDIWRALRAREDGGE